MSSITKRIVSVTECNFIRIRLEVQILRNFTLTQLWFSPGITLVHRAFRIHLLLTLSKAINNCETLLNLIWLRAVSFKLLLIVHFLGQIIERFATSWKICRHAVCDSKIIIIFASFSFAHHQNNKFWNSSAFGSPALACGNESFNSRRSASFSQSALGAPLREVVNKFFCSREISNLVLTWQCSLLTL